MMAEAELPIQALQDQRGLLRRSVDWLLSQRHFHLKVISGTAAGVTVILTLAAVFLWITLRDHYQDAARAHTIDVMRLSSLIENDIASLETAHRGFLLAGTADYLASFEKRKAS